MLRPVARVVGARHKKELEGLHPTPTSSYAVYYMTINFVHKFSAVNVRNRIVPRLKRASENPFLDASVKYSAAL